MSFISAALAVLFTALVLGNYRNVQAASLPLTFGDRCRMSTQFAQLFVKRCDPYLPAQDCQVGDWSGWTPSKGTCNQIRSRRISSSARKGGKACPSLQEVKNITCQPAGSKAQQLLDVLKSGLGGFGSFSPGLGLRQRAFVLSVNDPLPPINVTKLHSLSRRQVVDCPGDRDIVIIIDTSGSVGSSNFQSALTDLSELIPLLCGYQPDLITQCRAYRLAMMTYGSSPSLTFDLDDNLSRHTNPVNVQNDIQTKPVYTGGLTATGDALQLARDRVLQTAHGMRPNSKKTILLLTDGHYNHGTYDPISVAADMFTQFQDKLSIVALGIGNDIDYEELKDITNHHNAANPLVFLTESFFNFHAIVEEIKSLLTNQQTVCSIDVLVKKR